MMNDKIFSYLGDPVKAKLILEIYDKKQATTVQLAEKFNNIPQATLYRYLKKMLADGVLIVVGENRVRGTVEKVYSVDFDFEESNRALKEENDGKTYLKRATLLMLSVLNEFKGYADKTDIDVAGDVSGLSVVPIYATKEEITEAIMKINDIISPLISNRFGGERELRNLCLIITPPKNQ